jgi:hypothetical protein
MNQVNKINKLENGGARGFEGVTSAHAQNSPESAEELGRELKNAIAKIFDAVRQYSTIQVTFYKYPYITWVSNQPVKKYPEPYFYTFRITNAFYGWEVEGEGQKLSLKSQDEVKCFLMKFLDENFPLGIPYRVEIARKHVDVQKLKLEWVDEEVFLDKEYFDKLIPTLRLDP